MSRKLVIALTAFVALNGLAGGSLLLTGAANSAGSQAFAAETDPLSAREPTPTRTYIPAYLAMIDFEHVFAGPNALPESEYVPVVLTAAIDFQQVFRSVSAASRDNTPPNREKLRNAGWRRLLEAS